MHRAVAVMLLALTVVAVPSAAQAVPDGTITIGDSVMLGARWALEKQGIDVVDAKKSRQASTGASLVRAHGASLPRNVVVHLGTNGVFPDNTCRDLVAAAGPQRHVYLLTLNVPRKWESTNNVKIRRCAAVHADQVSIIDWRSAAKAHPKWLYSDGIHLRPAGAKGYARLIADAVGSSE